VSFDYHTFLIIFPPPFRKNSGQKPGESVLIPFQTFCDNHFADDSQKKTFSNSLALSFHKDAASKRSGEAQISRLSLVAIQLSPAKPGSFNRFLDCAPHFALNIRASDFAKATPDRSQGRPAGNAKKIDY
jgi:hypothetical protein